MSTRTDRGGAPVVIVGERSNLSRALHAARPSARLVSGTHVLSGGAVASADGPVRLVLNAFQPAVALRDIGDPAAYVERAIGVTARVLGALTDLDVERLIYTSSASVYGDNILCSESDPARPLDLHASLKLANEHLVRTVCTTRGVRFTIARVFNMYGGDDRFSVVSKVIAAARDGGVLALTNGGNAIRDFVHIDDVVRSYEAMLDGDPPEALNVASGRGVSIAGMLDTLRRAGVPVRTTDVRRTEIRVSTANVDALAALVDVAAFRRVEDYVLERVGA